MACQTGFKEILSYMEKNGYKDNISIINDDCGINVDCCFGVERKIKSFFNMATLNGNNDINQVINIDKIHEIDDIIREHTPEPITPITGHIPNIANTYDNNGVNMNDFNALIDYDSETSEVIHDLQE